MIMDHISHIQGLKIRWEQSAAGEGIMSILHDGFSNQQVPVLESFELSSYEGIWDGRDSGKLYYPANAPALRRLSLNDVIVPWDSTLFRNLTELYLYLWYDGVQADELFNILRACPDLTTLFFEFDHGAESASQITTHARSINLPYLTEITLRNLPSSTFQAIVQSIDVSQHANWYIADKYPQENMVSSMCDIIRATVAHMEVSQPRALTLALGESEISLFSSQFGETDSDPEKIKDDVFVVEFDLPSQDDYLNHAPSQLRFFSGVAQFISAFNVNNNIVQFSIQFLRCWNSREETGHVLYESSFWTKPFLLVLPSLECLVFKLLFKHQETIGRIDDGFYYYKMGFMEGMISNLVMQDYNRNHLSGVLCPKLRSVEIMHGYGPLSGQLIQLLRSRSNIGIPIRTLKMTWSDKILGGIPLSYEWLNKAKEYAERVSVGTQADQEERVSVFRPNW